MKARIKVESFETSIWGGLKRMDYQETTHLVETGDRISTVGLEQPYQFAITGIRPNAVELFVSPQLCFQTSGEGRVVGALTLEVGEQASLQTQSFDAWGNWVITLQGVATTTAHSPTPTAHRGQN